MVPHRCTLWYNRSVTLNYTTELKPATSHLTATVKSATYGVDHKIKHFACEKDFFWANPVWQSSLTSKMFYFLVYPVQVHGHTYVGKLTTVWRCWAFFIAQKRLGSTYMPISYFWIFWSYDFGLCWNFILPYIPCHCHCIFPRLV